MLSKKKRHLELTEDACKEYLFEKYGKNGELVQQTAEEMLKMYASPEEIHRLKSTGLIHAPHITEALYALAKRENAMTDINAPMDVQANKMFDTGSMVKASRNARLMDLRDKTGQAVYAGQQAFISESGPLNLTAMAVENATGDLSEDGGEG